MRGDTDQQCDAEIDRRQESLERPVGIERLLLHDVLQVAIERDAIGREAPLLPRLELVELALELEVHRVENEGDRVALCVADSDAMIELFDRRPRSESRSG